MYEAVKILDHGYLRLIETWGHGDAGDDLHKTWVDDGVTYNHPLPTDNECGIIEAARQSTQGSFRGWEQDEKLLAFMFKNKHSTPFEFCGMTIEVQAPIACFREWHRHRTQSFSEMSARYSPLPDLNYVPTVERLMMVNKTNKQAGTIKGAEELTEINAMQWLGRLCALYERAEEVYQDGLKRGIPKELARLCLPVGRYSRMRASANLRNWLAFLTLRMDPAAQWEIRQFAHEVGGIIKVQFPRTWELFAAL